jgi:hypothetical protein
MVESVDGDDWALQATAPSQRRETVSKIATTVRILT